MRRLTPKKEIRENIIFSHDEQTQKICMFAGEVEDLMEKYEIDDLEFLDTILLTNKILCEKDEEK